MTTAVHRFRMAMARHLGRTITPEVAAQIEAEAFYEPDQAVSPERFEPVKFGGYRIQLESFRAIQPELHYVHADHWKETEKYRHGFALNPDYDALAARERAGRLLQFTVRRGDELAGHLRMFTGRSLHTQTLMAEEDTLYMRPEHRGGFTAMALLRYAESALADLQVPEIRANSKVINHADVLMRRMRYQHVGNLFVKFLGGHHGEA